MGWKIGGRLRNFMRMFVDYGPVRTLRYVKKHVLLLAYRIVNAKLIKRKIFNFEMFLDPMDRGISATLFLFGTREEQLKYVLEKEIKRGDTIIDLGANIGYYALMEWMMVGPSGKIYALEPSPKNYSLLKKNVALNGAQNVIEVFQLAGGAQVSREKLFLSAHSNLNTFISELYRCGALSKEITDDFTMVDVVDMITFIAGKREIDLIRMDIEGFEVEVLKGLKKAIETGTFTGKIVFECHFPKYDDENHSMREQLEMLFSNGYFPKIMTSNDEKLTRFPDRRYQPSKVIKTGVNRFQGIYYGVSPSDAIYFICDVGGVRDVLLEK